MADELDALLERVDDDGLRSELRNRIERLRRKRRFGLVFESHLPERVRLPDHPVRRGSKVVRRDAAPKETPQEVLQVTSEKAILAADEESEEVPLDDLVVVAEFGEPIYPGFRRLGSIYRGGDKPAHVVIKGENYHALEALRFSHAGKVDCIYIDPPYNTGARDWKYDNDYVDEDDRYRHSKWLAFMERRMTLARDLLNPEGSCLIVSIDEKEYLRLGLLLEQVFSDARQQMVSSVINPKGTGRMDDLARTNEYIFFVRLGDFPFTPRIDDSVIGSKVSWETTRRRNLASARGRRGKGACGPNQFYPIFVNQETGAIVGRGNPLSDEIDRLTVKPPAGCDAVFPVRKDGTEMNWEYVPVTFDQLFAEGYIRANGRRNEPQLHVLQHIPNKARLDIASGAAKVKGRRQDGTVIAEYVSATSAPITTQWDITSHSAEHGGTNLLKAFIPGRRFPFPKSLFAVEDCIRIAVGSKREATIVDFFAGSGTTAHAVARLNRQDSGCRTSISITNNEVSAREAKSLRAAGFRPGDDEWDRLGIFEHITRPRITAAIRGKKHDGELVNGDYKVTDIFPMSDGFKENVEFFELKYLDLEDVELDLAFESVAPMLWLRAGGGGAMIDQRRDETGELKTFDMTKMYGVLFDADHWRAFVEKMQESVTTVFVVTESPSVFASVAAELPTDVDVIRLYENYLTNFGINRGL